MTWVLQGSFGAGEISPGLRGLVTEPVVLNGCKELTNAFITRFGGVKKRAGTKYIIDTLGNDPARLFAYRPALGGDYIVQLTSQDAGGFSNLTVISGSSYVTFADGLAKSPFPDPDLAPTVSTGPSPDPSSYRHSYTEAELLTLRAVQYRDQIIFLCPTKPPTVLERKLSTSGTEKWDWGLLRTIGGDPAVREVLNPAGITMTFDGAPFQIYSTVATDPIFHPNQVGSIWRLGELTEGPITTGTNRYGNWFEFLTYETSTEGKFALINSGQALAPAPIFDSRNWYGPIGITGSDISFTISGGGAMSIDPDNPSTVTATAGTFNQDDLGTLILTDSPGNPVVALITTVNSDTTATMVWLGGPLPSGAFTARKSTQIAINGRVRPWAMFSATIASDEVLYTMGAVGSGGDDIIPDNHDVSFDRENNEGVGGVVRFKTGAVSLYAEVGNDTNFRSWNYKVRTAPQFNGPFNAYGIGWSTATGFPSVGVTHQDRLFLSGISGASDLILASATGTSEDYNVGANADDAISLRVANTEGGAIKWMLSFQDLLFGTDLHEFKLSGSPISSQSLGVDRQTAYGGKNVASLQAGPFALFVGRGGRNLRQASFDARQRDRYIAPDLTDNAEHLFPNGYSIERLAYAAHPDQLVTALVSNGTRNLPYCLTLRPENRVQGWSEWDLGSDDDIADIVTCGNEFFWMVVERTIDSVTKRYIERIEANATTFDTQISTTSQISISGVAAGEFLPLILETVGVTADGVYLGDVVVTAGGGLLFPATINPAPTTVEVGYNYTYTLIPNVHQLRTRDFSSTAGLLRRFSRALVFLRDSRGLVTEGYSLQTIPGATTSAAIAAIDGWTDIPVLGEHGRDPDVSFTQSVPYDIEIAAVNLDMGVE
jgi:hypothetical protein